MQCVGDFYPDSNSLKTIAQVLAVNPSNAISKENNGLNLPENVNYTLPVLIKTSTAVATSTGTTARSTSTLTTVTNGVQKSNAETNSFTWISTVFGAFIAMLL